MDIQNDNLLRCSQCKEYKSNIKNIIKYLEENQ